MSDEQLDSLLSLVIEHCTRWMLRSTADDRITEPVTARSQARSFTDPDLMEYSSTSRRPNADIRQKKDRKKDWGTDLATDDALRTRRQLLETIHCTSTHNITSSHPLTYNILPHYYPSNLKPSTSSAVHTLIQSLRCDHIWPQSYNIYTSVYLKCSIMSDSCGAECTLHFVGLLRLQLKV